jgi:hypothetical protein
MVDRFNDYHDGNCHFQDRFDIRRIADQSASRTRDHIDEPARTRASQKICVAKEKCLCQDV